MTVELRALARTDALTGLANRRAFNEAIELEFRRCRRFATSAAVLMMDIDHFKKINDTHGHDAGDAALVELGRVLTQATRAFDVTARLGGEEFVMLVPGTDIPGAIALAERLRLMVAGMELHSAKGAFCMSASIGVTAFARGDCDWAEVLARADRALYQAKSLGRNRVVATRVEDTA
jgi:diguanylate cyclase (GGDEF)-like protein